MEEQQYSIRELEHIFKDFKTDLIEIKEQVKTTNRRVSALENWRWFITGGIAILTVLVLPVVLQLIFKFI